MPNERGFLLVRAVNNENDYAYWCKAFFHPVMGAFSVEFNGKNNYFRKADEFINEDGFAAPRTITHWLRVDLTVTK